MNTHTNRKYVRPAAKYRLPQVLTLAVLVKIELIMRGYASR